ncbi:MAG: ATP-binding protein, partial [Treponema sp.]|nr:ATP-binding protein [Treponema sp.]
MKMIEVINERLDLCVGCNRCVRKCSMETANVTYQDVSGKVKVKIDHERCITCGLCVSACKHDARSFSDDTERLFKDLANGVPVSFIAAPSIKTNIPGYKNLFTCLKRFGANKIYDVSLGADICIWAHVRYLKENGIAPMITQPCPVIVNYCELYRHDLIKRLSPIHSPMACTSIYMKKYQGINDRIAALSPCMAKANEFESTKLADYNITFTKLFEYMKLNGIELPDEETEFDHAESGLGSMFPMPGGFKENIEYFMGKNLHVTRAEGFSVYEKLDKYAKTPEEFLPDIYDVLNCTEGCNIGTASLHDRCFFEIDKTMKNAGKTGIDESKKKHYESTFNTYNDMLDLDQFMRKYKAIPVISREITDADIGKAFESLGKTNYEKQHIDCFACGSKTCFDMARKIALNINIPHNCIIKVMEDAKIENDRAILAQAQIAVMEKTREGDERVRAVLDAAAKRNEAQLAKTNLIIKATQIALWDMHVVYDDPANPVNAIFYSDEFRHMLGYENENDFPSILKSWSDKLHPGDKERVINNYLEHMFDKTIEAPFDMEYRLLKKNGEYGFFRAIGETTRDKEGNPIHLTGSMIDVTQTKNLINEAERQRIEAETANKAKTNFLSHISHEIRTPMNAILGTVEIQLQKETNPPDIEEAFNTIYSSGNLLLNIINDILDLSKIEAGKLEILPVQYDIPSIIYDTVQLILLRYDSKPIEFDLKIDKNTPLDMIGDELRIKQILNNILSNAFKYTEKGNVELSVSAEITKTDSKTCNTNTDIVLVLRISDTGQGLTETQINKLFDEYTRFNTDANRTIVGTGLGMHITKRLIDAMNGTITVESVFNKGSVFTVRIPQERVGNKVCGTELADKMRDNRFKGTLKHRVQIAHEYMPYGSIMIVDDVESNLYVAKGMMLPYGMKIETVSSGSKAVDKIRKGEKYDIIFMDHMMPVMNGIEATKFIRDMGYTNPIIALTANAVTGSSVIFLSNGFDGFLSKPIDIRELNSLLNRLVRDEHPDDVVKAARQQMEQQKPVNGSIPGSTQIKSDFKKILIQDIKKALVVLENILPKLTADNNANGIDDINLYITTVHGMKSVLLNIGESKLSAAALKLEQAGEAGKITEIVTDTPSFMNALRFIVEKHTPKTFDNYNEISANDMIFLKEKLSEIKTACERIQKRAAKTALDELRSKIWPHTINELLDEVSIH